jgi:hypothetical protein
MGFRHNPGIFSPPLLGNLVAVFEGDDFDTLDSIFSRKIHG